MGHIKITGSKDHANILWRSYFVAFCKQSFKEKISLKKLKGPYVNKMQKRRKMSKTRSSKMNF